jgi:hypothetical protein
LPSASPILWSIPLLITGKHLQPPAFDEYKAATALGWLGDLVLGLTTGLLICVLLWLGFALPRGQRLGAWAGLLLGTAAGWIARMQFVGPLVLP